MNSNKTEALVDILEANLIPAVVPVPILDISDSPHVILEQPRSLTNNADGSELTRSVHHYSRRNNHQYSNNPEGLAPLAVADEIIISLDQSCLHCINSSTNYFISNTSQGEESLIFRAVEASTFCRSIDSLRNVVIRDKEDVPVARVCFKEKHLLLESLVLAIYSPPETLIGTSEQSPTCFVFPSEFVLGDADGNHLFRINYDRGICYSQFSVTSLQHLNDGSTTEEKHVAQILEKSQKHIKVKFLSKMNITNKLILVGFCIGVIHKRMSQQRIEQVPTT